MKPINLPKRAWALLSGTRLTRVCMAVLLVLALGFQADVVERLRLWGLDDAVSKGFIFVLGLLGLNLVCGVLASFAELWGASNSAPPASVEGGGAEKKQLRSELESRLSKDALVELARRFGRQKLGRSPRLTQTPGGFELAAKRGRLSSLLHSLAHLSFGVALVGAWMMKTQGFEARVPVEEATRARSVELVRGNAPEEWKDLAARDSRLHGYFDPGFEIERVAAPESELAGASLFRFYEDGKLAGSVETAPGRPARYRGLTLHLLDYAAGSAQSVSIETTDRASGSDKMFAELSKGQKVDLEDFSFQVLEVQSATDLNGPAVQLEYQEHGKSAERFWIFVDFPDYDFAHRKAARQHFTLKSVRPRSTAVLQLGKEPGAIWLWGGLALMAFLFWGTMARPEEKFWIRWTEGKSSGNSPVTHKLELIGWSAQSLMFEPHFYGLSEQLEQAIEKAEATDAPA